MMTKWKDAYPRPQLVRDKWLSLDGEWTFSIKKTNEAGLPPGPKTINVPFALRACCQDSTGSHVRMSFCCMAEVLRFRKSGKA